MIRIRDAVDGDIPAITEITNALIATTTYEWRDDPHTVEDRRRWLAAKQARGFPVLVAVDGAGEVVGWAGYGDFRDTERWPGYLPTVEHTVHVRGDRWGNGVGRDLVAALIERARRAGKRVVVAGIDGENLDSIRFHERLGFVEVARMPDIGEKLGRPLTLVLMQRRIDGEEPT